MARRWTTWTWSDGAEAADLWRLIHDPTTPEVVVVLQDRIEGVDRIGGLLVDHLDEPLAATVSPIPLPAGPTGDVEVFEPIDPLPPPPTLGEPNGACVACSVDVLRSVWIEEPAAGVPWVSVVPSLARLIVNRGWRHVGAPGVGLGRASIDSTLPRDGGWGAGTLDEIEGPANESLATHRLWIRTRRGIRLVVDAACLDGGQHNGSQALVAHVSRALAATRPDATVSLAVERRNLGAVRATAPQDVDVIERGMSVDADVVYRPYQLLVPGELAWLARTGERLIVGQLDMIGFSNPSYHPSPALFHAVRNLQRLTMRLADAVTFISEFGLRHALVECPDLQRDRCFVVSSGASRPERFPTSDEARRPFVLCLSAVFWHKHREHAIRTFASMVNDHGYAGELRIAGPEPHYGRSSAAEAALVASLPDAIRSRIRHLGQVDDTTRWRLLAGAELVLYPSIVEGFGMVPFEAAAVGTPTLVAPGSALEEVFAGTGAVVESWDVREWAERATAVVRSHVVSDDLVAALSTLADEHSWTKVADATWTAIDEVVARPRARLHHEEGGALARITQPSELSASAPAVHFANRVAAYGRRRLDAVRPRPGDS